jgi:F0F1-type ATP synthase membrane subunit b/b'
VNLETLAVASQIAGAVIFVVAAIVIWNKYIAPGVKAYQAAKNAELAEAESRRERMRADVGAARSEVETAEAAARVIRERVEAAAAADRAKTLEDAQHEAERIVHNAEGELERARLAARDRLRVEFIVKALAKARAEAHARVSGATNTALVERTIADLVRGKS